MASKGLFAPATVTVPATNATNEAGGRAYAFSPEHALAQYSATGCFNSTYYSSDEEQLKKAKELCLQVSPEFLAKTAIYAREKGFMKDMPAFMAAQLMSKDVKLLSAAFPRIIDNSKMLRNFVQIVRSGVTGRKSLGTAPKRLIRQWFANRSLDTIFRQSVGSDPSLADVIKLSRPSPKTGSPEETALREAFYGYLIGKKVDLDKLPALVRQYEQFKAGETLEVPKVPFEMLTALPLGKKEWLAIAKNMSWTQLRMNLNTLSRHEVFEDKGMVKEIAAKLRDPELIAKSRVFPYQLLMAYTAINPSTTSTGLWGRPSFQKDENKKDIPKEIILALHDAVEISVKNVPVIDGQIYVCPDVSGSMSSPITGNRKGSTTNVRCVDAAALVAAALMRANPMTEVLPFDDHVHKNNLNPKDSILTNATALAKFGGGGTSCNLPLEQLNKQKAKGDLVIYISDNMSWMEYYQKGYPHGYYTNPSYVQPLSSPMAKAWQEFKRRNPKAKLVLIDIQPYGTTQVQDDPSVLNIGGFSDHVFELLSLFVKGELTSDHWVGEINKITL